MDISSFSYFSELPKMTNEGELNLTSLRTSIDKIDASLVNLLNERANVIMLVICIVLTYVLKVSINIGLAKKKENTNA